MLPLQVQRASLDAYKRIGEDVKETVEHCEASLVVVRGRYIPKTDHHHPHLRRDVGTSADSAYDKLQMQG